MKKTEVVIVGLGFLATYIMPCYEKLMGEDIGAHVLGIKGSDRGLAEKRAVCPFPVEVGNVDRHLKERRPDLIVLAVKPDQIRGMTEGTLAPYYQMLRENKEPLPDLYSFAPSPSVDYYYDTLGPDVNAANMIPNMVREIEGVHVAPVGVSFVAFDPRRAWPEENKRRAMEFMTPTGAVVEIDGDKAIPFLAAQVAGHMMFEFNYIVQDVEKARGQEMTLAQSASAFRCALRKWFSEDCTKVLPCGNEAAGDRLRAFMELTQGAWRQGVLRFAKTEGIPEQAADRMICGTMETFHMEAQLEPREILVQNTKNHATPGGYLEMGLKTFYGKNYDFITELLNRYLDGRPQADDGEKVAQIAFQVAKAVSDHGKQMVKKD